MVEKEGKEKRSRKESQRNLKCERYLDLPLLLFQWRKRALSSGKPAPLEANDLWLTASRKISISVLQPHRTESRQQTVRLDTDLSPEPRERNAALLYLDFSLGKPGAENKPNHAVFRFLIYRTVR